MIIGIIVFIFCVLGIFGYFDGNILLTYIGFAFASIEHVLGIYTGAEKGLTTVWMAALCAFGMAIAGNNLIESIAICLCFENVISFSLGVILLCTVGVATSKLEEDNKTQNEKSKVEVFEEPKNKYEEYKKLLLIIEVGSGIKSLDEAIKTFFEFYTKKNIEIPFELSITKGKTAMQRFENLLTILEIGIGVKGIHNIQKRLFDFYKSKGIDFPFDNI